MFLSACVPPSTKFGQPRQLPEESEIPSMECRHQGRNSYRKLNSRAHIFRAVFFPICVIKELWLLITSQEKLQISRQIKEINRFESILLLRLFLGKIHLSIVIQKDLPRSLTVLFLTCFGERPKCTHFCSLGRLPVLFLHMMLLFRIYFGRYILSSFVICLRH